MRTLAEKVRVSFFLLGFSTLTVSFRRRAFIIGPTEMSPRHINETIRLLSEDSFLIIYVLSIVYATVHVLVTFYCDKLDDIDTVIPALKGLVPLVNSANCTDEDAIQVVQS